MSRFMACFDRLNASMAAVTCEKNMETIYTLDFYLIYFICWKQMNFNPRQNLDLYCLLISIMKTRLSPGLGQD